jgi:hypothetical protein
MAVKAPFQKILDLAGKFVAEHQGDWDHAAWETLVADAAKLGYAFEDEGRRNLGNILEASKYFRGAPVVKPKRKAAPRKKSATKPKAKAKSKSTK